MWVLEFLKDWCVTKGILERIIPKEAQSPSRPVAGNDKNRHKIANVQGDIKVPEGLREQFASFPSIFEKNERM